MNDSEPRRSQFSKNEIRCWLCDKKGHRANECSMKKKIVAVARIFKEETDEDDKRGF